MFLWAYASLGERMGSTCLDALVGQAQKELQRFSVQGLGMLLWSLCILQVHRGPRPCSVCQRHQQRSSCCHMLDILW